MNAIDFLLNFLYKPSQPVISPLSDEKNIPQKKTTEKYKKAILGGLKEIGKGENLPIATVAGELAKAGTRGGIYDKYPFLPVAVAILESSGGKNVTYKNNPLNWGIQPQAAGIYNPASWEQSIQDMISGVGGRTAEQGYTPDQIRTASYYDKFRKSGELLDFAQTYAPLSENPTTGGPIYADRAQGLMDIFKKYLK